MIIGHGHLTEDVKKIIKDTKAKLKEKSIDLECEDYDLLFLALSELIATSADKATDADMEKKKTSSMT